MQPSVIGSKQRVISGFIELDWQHVMMQEKEPAYGIKPAQIDKIVSPGSGRTKESINYGSSKCRVGASKQRESTRKMSRSELMSVSQVSETDPYQRRHGCGEKHQGPDALASYNSKRNLQISSLIMTWVMLEMPSHRPDPRTTESESTFTKPPNGAHNIHLRNT